MRTRNDRKKAWLLGALALLTQVGCGGASHGSSVDSKETGCVIQLPSAPLVAARPVNVKGETVTINHSYESKKDHRSYTLCWCDYKPEVVQKQGANKLLLGAMDGELQSVRGVLGSKKNVTLADGTAGIEFTFLIPGEKEKEGSLARSRVFLASNRLYQIITIQQNDELSSAESRQVLDSFALKK